MGKRSELFAALIPQLANKALRTSGAAPWFYVFLDFIAFSRAKLPS
jgi:hypothetical protein